MDQFTSPSGVTSDARRRSIAGRDLPHAGAPRMLLLLTFADIARGPRGHTVAGPCPLGPLRRTLGPPGGQRSPTQRALAPACARAMRCEVPHTTLAANLAMLPSATLAPPHQLSSAHLRLARRLVGGRPRHHRFHHPDLAPPSWSLPPRDVPGSLPDRGAPLREASTLAAQIPPWPTASLDTFL